MAQAEADGIRLKARPIDGTTLNYEIFDDDLPRAGIAAVWVQLQNVTPTVLNLSRIRWHLRVGNLSSRNLDAKSFLRRFYEGRKIRMYSLAADEEATKEFEAIAFRSRELKASETVEGFVFFKVDPSLAESWTHVSLLGVRDIEQPDGRKIRLELPIRHARP